MSAVIDKLLRAPRLHSEDCKKVVPLMVARGTSMGVFIDWAVRFAMLTTEEQSAYEVLVNAKARLAALATSNPVTEDYF